MGSGSVKPTQHISDKNSTLSTHRKRLPVALIHTILSKLICGWIQ